MNTQDSSGKHGMKWVKIILLSFAWLVWIFCALVIGVCIFGAVGTISDQSFVGGFAVLGCIHFYRKSKKSTKLFQSVSDENQKLLEYKELCGRRSTFGVLTGPPSIEDYEGYILQLEQMLRQRDATIEELTHQDSINCYQHRLDSLIQNCHCYSEKYDNAVHRLSELNDDIAKRESKISKMDSMLSGELQDAELVIKCAKNRLRDLENQSSNLDKQCDSVRKNIQHIESTYSSLLKKQTALQKQVEMSDAEFISRIKNAHKFDTTELSRELFNQLYLYAGQGCSWRFFTQTASEFEATKAETISGLKISVKRKVVTVYSTSPFRISENSDVFRYRDFNVLDLTGVIFEGTSFPNLFEDTSIKQLILTRAVIRNNTLSMKRFFSKSRIDIVEFFSQLKTDSVDCMFDEAHIKAIDISSMEFTGDKLESTFIQNAVIDSLKYLDGNTVQESRVIPT